MHCARAENKHVPDGMVVREFFERVENDTDGIGDAAGGEQLNALRRDCFQRWLDSNRAKPTHGDIDERRQYRKAGYVPPFENDSNNGERPNCSKQGPAYRSTKVQQGKRRVGAGNEQVYRAMVEYAQKMLNPGLVKAVIEGGGEIQRHQAGAIHGKTDDHVGVALVRRRNDEHHQPNNAEHEAYAVRNAVRQLFSQLFIAQVRSAPSALLPVNAPGMLGAFTLLLYLLFTNTANVPIGENAR